MKTALLLALVLCSGFAQAASYKCVDREGKISFSFTPCPTWEGDSTLYSETQETHLADPQAASDEVIRRQLNAERIMRQGNQQPRKNQLTVVPDNTSTMGRERAARQAREERAAERQRRIDSGEWAPEERQPVRTVCSGYSSGYGNSTTVCTSK